jgi:hypothetical protein
MRSEVSMDTHKTGVIRYLSTRGYTHFSDSLDQMGKMVASLRLLYIPFWVTDGAGLYY